MDVTLKTILSTFLSNQLSQVFLLETLTVPLLVCMESDGPLQSLQEQAASTYLFSQINPVYPFQSYFINIHFNIIL